MLIRLAGLGNELDGEYELEHTPTTREIVRFRKEAGLSPSDMLDVLTAGGLEVVPFYVYTALHRNGRPELAALVLDVPFDQWEGADVAKAPSTEDASLPPASGPGGPGS